MFGWFIGWLDDLPNVWSLIYQIKCRDSDFLASLYKRVRVCVSVSGYSRCYRRCWNAAEWVQWRRFIAQTRRHLRNTAGTVT